VKDVNNAGLPPKGDSRGGEKDWTPPTRRAIDLGARKKGEKRKCHANLHRTSTRSNNGSQGGDSRGDRGALERALPARRRIQKRSNLGSPHQDEKGIRARNNSSFKFRQKGKGALENAPGNNSDRRGALEEKGAKCN